MDGLNRPSESHKTQIAIIKCPDTWMWVQEDDRAPVWHGDLEEDRPQQRGGRKRGRKESDPPQKTMSCLKSEDMSLKLSF